jgi:hypothetical protein
MRTCCGPSESAPATAQGYTATPGHPPVQSVALPVSGAAVSTGAVLRHLSRVPRGDIRLLNSVFLI